MWTLSVRYRKTIKGFLSVIKYMATIETKSPLDIKKLGWNSDLRSIDPSIFRDVEWDFMNPVERDELLGHIYSILVRRAQEKIPFYAELYKGIDTSRLADLGDILNLPIVRKESTKFSKGLRDAVRQKMSLLKPVDVTGETIWTTTGSTGMTQIPIAYTEWDFEIENNAVARIWDSLGVTGQYNVYDCYNPAHPGGFMFPEVCRILGASHRFKPPEFSLEDVARELREWRDAGSPYTFLLAVPSPIGDPLERKGTNFESLYNQATDVFGENGINKVFLIGSGITPELIERIEAEMHGIKVSGAYGTAEHRPLSYSPTDGDITRVCKYNQQHLTLGPHYLFVGRDEGDKVVPIDEPGEGEVFTIALRHGTPFILYKTGDLATVVTKNCPCGRTTPVIRNIRRYNPKEIEGVGCRYD